MKVLCKNVPEEKNDFGNNKFEKGKWYNIVYIPGMSNYKKVYVNDKFGWIFQDEIWDYFYTEKEVRKMKLDKIKNDFKN